MKESSINWDELRSQVQEWTDEDRREPLELVRRAIALARMADAAEPENVTVVLATLSQAYSQAATALMNVATHGTRPEATSHRQL